MTALQLLGIGMAVGGLGAYLAVREVRGLLKRLDRMEAIVADVRPDLLALPPKSAEAEPDRKRCGFAGCKNYANPKCPVSSCARCCRKFCYDGYNIHK